MRPKEDPSARTARIRSALISQANALGAHQRKACDYLGLVEHRLANQDRHGAAMALLTVQGAILTSREIKPIQTEEHDDEIDELRRRIAAIRAKLNDYELCADEHFLRLVTVVRF